MSESAERLRAMRELFESRGWKELCGVLHQQVEMRQRQVLMTPLSDANAVYGQEFMKGEVMGLQLAMATAASILEQCEFDQKEQSDVEENGSTEE